MMSHEEESKRQRFKYALILAKTSYHMETNRQVSLYSSSIVVLMICCFLLIVSIILDCSIVPSLVCLILCILMFYRYSYKTIHTGEFILNELEKHANQYNGEEDYIYQYIVQLSDVQESLVKKNNIISLLIRIDIVLIISAIIDIIAWSCIT